MLAMPTWALPMSSSVNPMACSMALEPGWEMVWVRREEYLLSFMSPCSNKKVQGSIVATHRRFFLRVALPLGNLQPQARPRQDGFPLILDLDVFLGRGHEGVDAPILLDP